jgi:starch phosphorylase
MFTNKETFKAEFERRLAEKFGRDVSNSHITERYETLGRMVRDFAGKDWRVTREKTLEKGQKQLIYFSMEFLIGRLLVNNMQNLGVYDVARDGLEDLGIDIHELEELESDAGLGNGGLGRLAACFLDSIASLGYPGHGNCIRYEYGFFKQKIVNGRQTEVPDMWLLQGNVWEVRKLKHAVDVKFYGNAETYLKPDGGYAIRTVNAINVKAIPYDISVVGYRNGVSNNLRLWAAEPSEENLPKNQKFENYLQTVKEITHGLYPDDTTEHGRLLRLRQQYFLVSAGLQSALRGHFRRYKTLKNLHQYYVFQLNDTHPILAIPELMRLLIDEYGLGWDQAWHEVTQCMAYTNHTIMAEALEKWPVHFVQNLIPRCYMIIEEIHRRSNIYYNEKNVSEDARRNMAIIKDGVIHMTNLAIFTVFSVNGVAALHTDILKKTTFVDFYTLFPKKFNNKTNGITHRRWFLNANPKLAQAVSERLGQDWITKPSLLKGLENFVTDKKLHKQFLDIKLENKQKLADYIAKKQGIKVDIHSIFDVQIKRLHAYKRQLMNVFHIMYLYQRIKRDPQFKPYPRTFIFGAKAAPSYSYAKKIIELINSVATKINQDLQVSPYVKVVFIENYGVTLAERIIPAADVSEQISTAGKEASGTGNMKFMMNGALTLGTLDGANVEISDLVGMDHCIIFGMRVNEVDAFNKSGLYSPWDMYHNDERIKNIMDSLIDGSWSDGNHDTFRQIFDEIMQHRDEYFVLKDFAPYVQAQEDMAKLYEDRTQWVKSAIINMAHSGFFSTDRTIEQYNADIWHLEKLNQDD